MPRKMNIDLAEDSNFFSFTELEDPEGITCLRCNTGTGQHSCWRGVYEAGSPDLDHASIRRFS